MYKNRLDTIMLGEHFISFFTIKTPRAIAALVPIGITISREKNAKMYSNYYVRDING